MTAPDPTEPVIRVRSLRTAFGTEVVHDNLDLDVRRGEVLAVVGGSGSGKSVLLRVLIGLLRPAAGTVSVFGAEVPRGSGASQQAVRKRWGVLFQHGALFSSLTIAENVAVPLRLQGPPPAALAADLIALKLALVGLPADAANKYPAELSGGMQKRAGLARALVHDPELLFLDEPTAGLDPIGAAAFDTLVHQLRDSLDLTVVMVTHDLDSLYALADRIAVLIEGRAVTGTLAELEQSDHPWLRQYFHGARARAHAS